MRAYIDDGCGEVIVCNVNGTEHGKFCNQDLQKATRYTQRPKLVLLHVARVCDTFIGRDDQTFHPCDFLMLAGTRKMKKKMCGISSG